MPRILIMCEKFPADLTDGNHLRVSHLCRELAGSNECFYFGPLEMQGERGALPQYGFSDAWELTRRPKTGRSFRRHFRLSNERFLEINSPKYFHSAVIALRQAVARWNIDAVVCFAPGLAEVSLRINVPKILDVTDSLTLTHERILSNRRRKSGAWGRMSRILKATRDKARERCLVRAYECTTTISDADRRALLRVSETSGDKIVVIPNGVSADALKVGSQEFEHERSIIFWGNLDFAPNCTAVEYFFDEIYRPYLARREIDWHIVGRGASDVLRHRLGHPRIHFHGFVDDLFSYAAQKGVMINPMIEGSGLKNKVLEALAINLPVVTTRMGVEAINGRGGYDFLVADEPKEFARCVESVLDDVSIRNALATAGRQLVESQYTWPEIAKQLDQLIRIIISQSHLKKAI
jgi:glycosyltransferase involved in cell wall biosynthesis